MSSDSDSDEQAAAAADALSQSTSQQSGSQQSASQNKCDRIWKLMNAEMRILGNLDMKLYLGTADSSITACFRLFYRHCS